jgi:hypothetical protein
VLTVVSLNAAGFGCMREDQNIELFITDSLGLPVFEAIHLESGVAVDHDHFIPVREAGVPAPRFQAGSVCDRCPSRYR